MRSKSVSPTTREVRLRRLQERARALAAESRSQPTRRAYETAWRQFGSFCAELGELSLPASPETVALYITERSATVSQSTISKDLAAIAANHLDSGLPSPTNDDLVRRIRRGVRRSKGTAPDRQVKPILRDDMRKLVDAIDDGSPRGTRDKAVLLLAWSSAARRSELAAFTLGDLEFVPEGIRLRFRAGKTDQEGKGVYLGVPLAPDARYCPVGAIRDWIAVLPGGDEMDDRMPLFREIRGRKVYPTAMSGRAVARAIKRACSRAGLSEDAYAGHSTRAGFATEAAKAGIALEALARHCRHRSLETTRRYVRPVNVFHGNAAAQVLSGAE